MNRRPRSRLALRIYVVMILAIAVVVAAVIFVKPRFAPHEPPPLHRLVQTLDQYRDDAASLKVELARVKSEYDLDVTLYGPDGQLLGSSLDKPPPPATADELRRLSEGGARFRQPPRRPGPPPMFGPMDMRRRPPGRGVIIPVEGDHAIVQFHPRSDVRFDVIIVLASLALASLVLARMIARPLQGIAAAARAFGAGDLAARSRVERRDEIGELSHTFDEMADRITHLLRGQRELLASVSHELRTPLSRIRVALDLAAEGDAKLAHQSLRDITEDLEELEELVSDVLAMARLEVPAEGGSGIPRLRTQEVDARTIAEKAATRFSGTHVGRRLEWDLGGGPPIPIDADPSLIRRVIENLLENAHKYSGPDVPIQLGLQSDGTSAVVTVADRGQGISPDDLPHVFEPFFRADRSRNRGTGGVGLGLALSRRIVEAHGGQITIESELDQGTTVTFTVPLAGRPA